VAELSPGSVVIGPLKTVPVGALDGKRSGVGAE